MFNLFNYFKMKSVVKELRALAKQINFKPEVFPNPRKEIQVKIYLYQFIEFIRKEYKIEITTEWFEDEYFSEAYGIEENYRDEEDRVKEYVSAEETLDKTYYLSQFKALKLLIPRILKEKELEK